MKTKITLHFYAKSTKSNSAGQFPIYVRLTINGKRLEFSTKKFVLPSKWSTEMTKMKGQSEEARSLNEYLDLMKSKVFDIQMGLIHRNEEITIEVFKNILNGTKERQRLLVPIFEEHNNKIKELIGIEYAPGTYERYKTSLKHTKDFLNWKYSISDIDITKIDHAFITDYEFYLRSVRKCANNTAVKYIKNFNKIIRLCLANDWLDKNPFARNIMGIICDVQLLDAAGKKYIQIKVNPYTVPVSLRGRYYYRSGSTKLELTGVELNEFLLKKAGKTWDDIIEESAHFSDIETKSVEAFKKEAFTSGRLPQDIVELPVKETLEKLRLATGDKIKRAAILLFGKNPNKFYPNIKVKIGRFGTNDADLRFQEVLEGNILELLKQVPEMLNSKFLTRPIVFEGLQRIEKDTYPVAAIREMLLNALVHRTYMGSMIQIRVYDDKLTIWNEGNLPEGMTIASLKGHHVSRPRNPLIADVCFKAGFIDSWGRGTLKIYEACENAGLPDATIASLDGGILVTLHNDLVVNQGGQVGGQDAITKSFEAIQKEFGLLSDRISIGKEKNSAFLRGNYGVFTGYLRGNYGRNVEEIGKKYGRNAINILMLFTLEPSIRTKDISEILGLAASTIEKVISKLKDDKVIDREGSTKSGLWKIIGQQ